MTPNRSVLQCPECQKPLVNIGSKVERIHPVARFIRERSTTIVMVWLPFIPLIMYLTSLVAGDLGGDRVIAFCFFALLLLPFAVNFFLLRLFPVWRITDCPYCGFHDEQKLGRSESGEL